jgi:hypothetical protein
MSTSTTTATTMDNTEIQQVQSYQDTLRDMHVKQRWCGMASLYKVVITLLAKNEELQEQASAFAQTLTARLSNPMNRLENLSNLINTHWDHKYCQDLTNTDPEKIFAPDGKGKIFLLDASMGLLAEILVLRVKHACAKLFNLRSEFHHPEDWNSKDWDSSKVVWKRMASTSLQEFAEGMKRAYDSFNNKFPEHVYAALTDAKTAGNAEGEKRKAEKTKLFTTALAKAVDMLPDGKQKDREGLANALVHVQERFANASEDAHHELALQLAKAASRFPNQTFGKLFNLAHALDKSRQETEKAASEDVKDGEEKEQDQDKPSDLQRLAACLGNPYLVNEERVPTFKSGKMVAKGADVPRPYDPAVRKLVPFKKGEAKTDQEKKPSAWVAKTLPHQKQIEDLKAKEQKEKDEKELKEKELKQKDKKAKKPKSAAAATDDDGEWTTVPVKDKNAKTAKIVTVRMSVGGKTVFVKAKAVEGKDGVYEAEA